MAASNSFTLNPLLLNGFATKKHTTDHTGLSSTRFSALELSSLDRVSLGATETHPTGCPFAYARIPGTKPESTKLFNALRFNSPCFCLNSSRPSLQYMHQQPPQAPLTPNSVSRSAHLPEVKA